MYVNGRKALNPFEQWIGTEKPHLGMSNQQQTLGVVKPSDNPVLVWI